MRPITNKPVQIHFECICGYNLVYTDYLPIKWNELSKNGIIRKKDRETGKPFLLHLQFSNVCSGHDQY